MAGVARLIHKRGSNGERIIALSHLEHRVWIQYVLSADDYGVMRASASVLRADNPKLEQEPLKRLEQAMAAVLASTLVQSFSHQGGLYWWQNDWQDFQGVQYPKDTILPAPPPDVLATATPLTRELFSVHHMPSSERKEVLQVLRKNRKKGVGMVPDVFQENTSTIPAYAGARIRETQTHTQTQTQPSAVSDFSDPRIVLSDGFAFSQDARFHALVSVVAGLPDHARVDAATFHRWIEQRLKAQGLPVRREVQVNDRGSAHTGFIDLVVDGEPPMAIELDYRTPRGRSQSKLTAFSPFGVVVLREAHEVTQPIQGLAIIRCQELPIAVSGRKSEPESLGSTQQETALVHTRPVRPTRARSLMGSHVGCYFAPDACSRGLCIPAWLGMEWLQQFADPAEGEREIATFVADTLARLPDGPVGDEPKVFWRAMWKARHGSVAARTGSRTGDTVDAAKEFLRERHGAAVVAGGE